MSKITGHGNETQTKLFVFTKVWICVRNVFVKYLFKYVLYVKCSMFIHSCKVVVKFGTKLYLIYTP